MELYFICYVMVFNQPHYTMKFFGYLTALPIFKEAFFEIDDVILHLVPTRQTNGMGLLEKRFSIILLYCMFPLRDWRYVLSAYF